MPRKEKTVFVLSGGGNVGAVQVGALQALLESGVVPDAIVGTSIGALNGAFLASHADSDGMEELADVWISVRRSDVFPLHGRSLVRGLLGPHRYLFNSSGLRALVERARLGFDRLEDAPIPLRVVATDIDSGEAVILRRGDVVHALLASSAMPGVFPPVELGGRTLLDGAVTTNWPLRPAAEFEPALVYVLPTSPASGSGSASASERTWRGESSHMRPSVVERWSAVDVRHVPVPELAGRVSMFDFGATRELIEEAHRVTCGWLGSEVSTWRCTARVAAESLPALPAFSGMYAGATA